MTSRTSFTFALTAPQQSLLSEVLTTGNYRPAEVPHARIAVRSPDCSITLFKSGKCLIQGKGAEEFVTFVMEPMVLGQAQLGYERVLNPEATSPHMGIDESGKGDFFGPMVIAAAYVDEELATVMQQMGVRDSKTITSDDKAMAMGRELRRLLGRRFAVVRIGPRAYNRLYGRMRNINLMLGWGHARAIEDLLNVIPDCPRAISDQFGSEQQVRRALGERGKRIELIQRHKAESDLAVAAASIIAREEFLRGLASMSAEYGMKIPKGASAQVQATARELARLRGAAVLVDVAKCHFKTTDTILAAVGETRAALGPDGQAVSRPYAGRPRRTKPADPDTSDR